MDGYTCSEETMQLRDENNRLRAEVEALRADAERWAAVKRMRWNDLQILSQQVDRCDFTERFDALAAAGREK